jgi:TrmH family RNA methyltransferase
MIRYVPVDPFKAHMSSSLQSMIRDLGLRRGRERRGLALAEGVRLVEEALAAGVPIRGAAVSPALQGTTRGRALKAMLVTSGVRIEDVTDAELGQLADTEQPQGVVAIIEPPRSALGDIDLRGGAGTPASRAAVLVLDAVQDPGNVGTMLRTALGLGAAGVVALKGTAELTSPKVLRGSMGALFRLPAVPATHEEFLAWAGAERVEIVVAAADGEPAWGQPRAAGPIAIVVGNEGAGVGAALSAAAARRVAIPLRPGAESLNVGVAAGILLYEVMRER